MSRSKKDILSMKEYLYHSAQSRSGVMEIGGSIFSHVAGNIGKIDAEFHPVSLSHKMDVGLYAAEIAHDPNHFVLVTLGLYEVCMKELVICLPKEWPVLRFYDTPTLLETLPVLLLREIVAALIRKNSPFTLAEGVTISKLKKPWNKLEWPEGINGVTLLNHNWTSSTGEEEEEDIPEDEVLTFYTLVPYTCAEKDLTPIWHDATRNAKWEEVAFTLDPRIALRSRMNQALADGDFTALRAAIADGGDINGRYYWEHNSFGWCENSSYLMRLCDLQNMREIKFAIEHGAIVEPGILASIAGWCTPDDAVFFLEQLEIDVNFIDHVGYTALDRAKAFKNKAVCHVLAERGGIHNGR